MNWLENLRLKIKGHRERESITIIDDKGKIIKIYEGIETHLPLGHFTFFETIDMDKFLIVGAEQ